MEPGEGFWYHFEVPDAIVQLADVHQSCLQQTSKGFRKIYKIGLSKMQFPAFPGQQFV